MSDIISQQIAYLNGLYIPLAEAQISPQDRGFLFGDGVYEVIPVYNKTLFYFDEHLQRLKNSLAATGIANPLSDAQWEDILNTLIEKHSWQDQFIYLQVTRGVQMQRDHMPADCLSPTIYAYTNPLKSLTDEVLAKGVKVVTLEDIRWLRCDIKAITLLPNVMLKLAAKQQGADDAILISRDGYVAEGTASNAFIVKNGKLLTPPTSAKILPGITRLVIESIAKKHHIELIEKELTQDELEQAEEIWLTSSTKEALPVTSINGKPVGDGKPGVLWQTLRQHYQQHKQDIIEQLGE